MGDLPVSGYKQYKIVKKRDFPTQRIPVGLDAKLWHARLRQQAVDAAFNNAKWAARRIAAWVETRRRLGTGVEDSLELLASDKAAAERLGLYQVHVVLRPLAMELARKIVQNRKEVAEFVQSGL